jgi:uncharacterized protein DUF2188
VTDARFSVSRAAQKTYKVVGGTRPAGANKTARDALSKAQATRKPDAVHVTHRKDGWAIKTEGRERAASVKPTKSKAVQEGRKTAADRGARLIEHGQDGRFLKNTKPVPKPSTKPKKK